MRTQEEIDRDAEAMVASWKRRRNELAKDMDRQKSGSLEELVFKMQVKGLDAVIREYEDVHGKGEIK